MLEFLDWWQDKQGYIACQLFNFNGWDVHTVDTDYFGDFKKRKAYARKLLHFHSPQGGAIA